jgi:uncharacterized membrane protein YkvA (DUF1232 family)
MLRGLWTLLSMTGIPRLIFRLMLDSRVPFRLKLLLPAAIAYIILPFDLAPDFIPLLGRIDDVLALVAAGLMLILLTPRDVLMDIAGAPVQEGGSRRPDDGSTVIDGEYRRLDE